MSLIRLDGIGKIFNRGSRDELTAVDGASLSIEAGRITALRGPSGSGKTTLLSLIGCMARPTSGRIFFGERELTSLPERFLTEIRRAEFGFIFQQFNLVRGITVLENVMLPAYPMGTPHHELKRRALELLELFGVGARAGALSERLSGGEAQRTAVARALINGPRVVIADEPTAHLDTKMSIEFMSIVGRLKEQGRTVVIASHDPLVYEAPVVDRVVSMRDGRIEGPAA
jgi:putative ABC transport system ATP-binding protein